MRMQVAEGHALTQRTSNPISGLPYPKTRKFIRTTSTLRLRSFATNWPLHAPKLISRANLRPRKVRPGHHAAGRASGVTCWAAAASQDRPSASKVLRFLDTNFISIALLSAIVLGWIFPGPGTFAAAHNLQTFTTIGIFVISGILLQRGEAIAALRSPLALAYGISSILFISPLVSLAIMRLPVSSPLALGLTVFCCVPTTLSTCVTLSSACRGNSAVALLLVIVTNILGVFTIPATLAVVLGGGGGQAATVTFNPSVLFINLVKTVLLPLLAGVALQVLVPAVADWRSRNRKLLSYVSTFFLCLVPWMQLSVSKTSQLSLTPAIVAAALCAGGALHTVLLTFNTAMTRVLSFNSDPSENRAIRKAVILCTSQKTLPVAVAVLHQLSAATGIPAGLAVLPCIMAHLMQIAIDSALVSKWNDAERKAAAASVPARLA